MAVGCFRKEPERTFTIVIEPTESNTTAHVIRLNQSEADGITVESHEKFTCSINMFDGSYQASMIAEVLRYTLYQGRFRLSAGFCET